MAISVVTATQLRNGVGNNVSGAVSATAGNALIVAGASYHGVDTTDAWSAARTGDTYTTDFKALMTVAGSNHEEVGIASAPNVAGGSVTMTVTSTGSNSGVECWAIESSGLATSSMNDAASPAVKTGTSTTATTNNLTNATANALFVSLIQTSSGSNPATNTTTGTGFSHTAGAVTMQDLDGANWTCLDLSWAIVSATGAKNGASTTENVLWGGGIAVYKMAAGAAGVIPDRAVTVLQAINRASTY